jgi:hypothetical protein
MPSASPWIDAGGGLPRPAGYEPITVASYVEQHSGSPQLLSSICPRSGCSSKHVSRWKTDGVLIRESVKETLTQHITLDGDYVSPRDTLFLQCTALEGPVVSLIWASAVYFWFSGHLQKPERTSLPIAVRLSMVVWARFMLAALIRPKLVFMVVRIRPASTRSATLFSNRPCSPMSAVL